MSKTKSGKIAAHRHMPSLRHFKVLHNICMSSALNCCQHFEALGEIIAKPQSRFFVCQQLDRRRSLNLLILKAISVNSNQGSYTPFIKTIGSLGYTRIDRQQLPLEQLQQSFRAQLNANQQRSAFPKSARRKMITRQFICVL
ncbi:MAG: DNA-binding transcriptional MocR family regulator [Psychromonas sp.]|jgi:DNA-binding transcriptional MocR family regulator